MEHLSIPYLTSQGLGNILEEEAERLYKPEVGESGAKQNLLGMIGPMYS